MSYQILFFESKKHNEDVDLEHQLIISTEDNLPKISVVPKKIGKGTFEATFNNAFYVVHETKVGKELEAQNAISTKSKK